MGRIHIEGFEQFVGAPVLADALDRADYDSVGLWTTVAGRAAPSYAISARGATLTRKAPWTAEPKFSVGFSFSMDARGSVAWLKIGGKQLTLWMHPDTGLPMLNDNVGGALPTVTRWYYYEIEIDRAGKASLYINNRFDSFVQMGALIGAEVEVSLGYLPPAVYRPTATPVPVDNAAKTYDDFYIHDGARLGPIAITTRFPDFDVNAEWFKASLNGSHASALSMRPPQPLDNYVASDTIGNEDRFKSAQPLANANAVVATGIVVLARKSPTLNAKLGVFIGGAVGAALRQDVRTVESEWRTQYICFEQVAGDTPAGIVGSEFGINVSP